MKNKQIIALIVFAAVMYGIGTMCASVLEEFDTVIYFLSGMIYASVGSAYVTCKGDEDDE